MNRNQGNKAGKRKPTGPRKGKSSGSNKPEGNASSFGKLKQQKPKRSKPPVNLNPDEIRLNKYIANSGMCTRREADLYISTGVVKVNGIVVTEMGYKVKKGDDVNFDGQTITPVEKKYILINKPKGFTTELNTSNEEKSVYYLLRNAAKSTLKPIGKMERNATGLLLMSNDDSFLASVNGSNRIRQIYHIELNKNLSPIHYDKILEGVFIEDAAIPVQELHYINDNKREIGIQLTSQRRRVVTRIFEKLGYTIDKIDRTVLGGLTKKDLPRGRYRELTKQELINLQMQR